MTTMVFKITSLTVVYSSVYTWKTSKLHVTGLCEGNSPGPVNSPHKGPVTRKMFPFDDVIMKTTVSAYCTIIWTQDPKRDETESNSKQFTWQTSNRYIFPHVLLGKMKILFLLGLTWTLSLTDIKTMTINGLQKFKMPKGIDNHKVKKRNIV